MNMYNEKNSKYDSYPVNQFNPLYRIIKLAKQSLYKSYQKIAISYDELITNALISNGKCHLVAVFKDYLIQDDISEFLKRKYSKYEAKLRLKKLTKYYGSTSLIFPNYTPLPESTYIYKNVLQKQKVIDKQLFNERLMKIKKKNKDHVDNIFNTEAYEEIINESNSMLIHMMGIKLKQKNNDDDDIDKIDNLINIIKSSENKVIRTKLSIDDTRIKIKLDTLTKLKIKEKVQHQHLLSMSNKSISSIKQSRNTKTTHDSSLTRQTTTSHHQTTMSMPKISIKRTPKLKHRLKLVVDSNLIKTVTSGYETSNRLGKRRSIMSPEIECHKKKLINCFRNPPASDRGKKTKKIIQINKMDKITNTIKNKMMYCKSIKGKNIMLNTMKDTLNE